MMKRKMGLLFFAGGGGRGGKGEIYEAYNRGGIVFLRDVLGGGGCGVFVRGFRLDFAFFSFSVFTSFIIRNLPPRGASGSDFVRTVSSIVLPSRFVYLQVLF